MLVAALPLWTWLLTMAVLATGGPGGGEMFGGPGFDEYAPLVLLFLGIAPPAFLLRRARRRPPGDATPAGPRTKVARMAAADVSQLLTSHSVRQPDDPRGDRG